MSRLRASVIAHLRSPRSLAGAMLFGVSAGIVVNALYLQPRPHPTPFFSTRITTHPAPQQGDELVRAVQDALKQIGFYAGPLDGILGPQTHTAIATFERRTGREQNGQATWDLLSAIQNTDRLDLAPALVPEGLPTAEPIPAPPQQKMAPPPDPLVTAVQKALALAAYGPVEADGVVGPQTRDAIRRFQRDHNLPVTGDVSDALIIELRAAGALDDG